MKATTLGHSANNPIRGPLNSLIADIGLVRGRGVSNNKASVLIRIFIPWLLAAIISQTGCVMVPIPTGEKKVLAGKPVSLEQFAFLSPNVTTKNEVVEHLGSPNLIWEDANLFAYDWVMRWGILIWAAGGGAGPGSAVGGIEDIPKRYVLLIQFDDQDRVRCFERTVRPWHKSYANLLKEWVSTSDTTSPQGLNDRKE